MDLQEETEAEGKGKADVEYEIGYEFDCFFTGAGWFIGTVVEVIEKEDAREVKFDGDDDEISVRVTVEELDRRYEEAELGEVGFKFVKRFSGNVVMNAKVVDISSKNRFVCRFDDEEIKTYTQKTLQSLMALNYPKLRDLGELKARETTNDADPGKNVKESDSDDEEETLEVMARKKHAHSCESSDSFPETGDEIESEDEEEDQSSRNTRNDTKCTRKTEQEQGKDECHAAVSNWNYGGWLMSKSLEELEEMKPADSLYMKLIEGNIHEIGERMKSMKLGERNVEIAKYPTMEDTIFLHNVLMEYSSGSYDDSIRETKKRWKMGRIDEFFDVQNTARCQIT